MSRIISILIAILIFSIIIMFHELGHFLLAKANGIRVNEFCLGFGPTLIGFTKGDTTYSIKLLPFGGACMMEGEDEESEDDAAFGKKSVWARMSVVFAGPFFNFIMAFVFSFILVSCQGIDKPLLTNATEGYAAAEAGMQAGDEIVKMNNYSVHFSSEINLYTWLHSGETIDVTYLRDGEKTTVSLKPKTDPETGNYRYGFEYSTQNYEKGNILTNIKNSFYEVRYWIYSTVQSLKMLFTGQVSVKELSGPVGIVKNMGDTYHDSMAAAGAFSAFIYMLRWTILLTANLGVMNLLPFPALDGGRLVFLLVEAIRGKKVNQKVEATVNVIGLLLLFALMFFVMFNDIWKLVR